MGQQNNRFSVFLFFLIFLHAPCATLSPEENSFGQSERIYEGKPHAGLAGGVGCEWTLDQHMMNKIVHSLGDA